MSTINEPTGHTYQQAYQSSAGWAQPGQAPMSQFSAQPYGQVAPVGYGQAVPPGVHGQPFGPVGKVRSTWAVIGLSLITFGIYGLYYYFATYEEMKQHSGQGVGGAVGLVLALFTFGLVTPFLLPNEVGNLYARQGRPRPVTAVTGLGILLGSLILIGPLVWLVKTNGALNAYWRSLGAV